MRRDVKKAQFIFKENILGFLVWAYCDYYKMSAQEFDMRYGSCCYYFITKERSKNYHLSTVRKVVGVLSLNQNQANTFFVFCRQVNMDGVFPSEKMIPVSIQRITWLSHMLMACRIIKPFEPTYPIFGRDAIRIIEPLKNFESDFDKDPDFDVEELLRYTLKSMNEDEERHFRPIIIDDIKIKEAIDIEKEIYMNCVEKIRRKRNG